MLLVYGTSDRIIDNRYSQLPLKSRAVFIAAAYSRMLLSSSKAG
jgi:hypothetical protein